MIFPRLNAFARNCTGSNSILKIRKGSSILYAVWNSFYYGLKRSRAVVTRWAHHHAQNHSRRAARRSVPQQPLAYHSEGFRGLPHLWPPFLNWQKNRPLNSDTRAAVYSIFSFCVSARLTLDFSRYTIKTPALFARCVRLSVCQCVSVSNQSFCIMSFSFLLFFLKRGCICNSAKPSTLCSAATHSARSNFIVILLYIHL